MEKLVGTLKQDVGGENLGRLGHHRWIEVVVAPRVMATLSTEPALRLKSQALMPVSMSPQWPPRGLCNRGCQRTNTDHREVLNIGHAPDSDAVHL